MARLASPAVEISLTLLLLVLCVASFLISTALGVAVGFVFMLALSIMLSASIPIVVICAFLLQNTVIAAFSPMVSDDAAFDSVRAVNFVLLMTAFGAVLLASILTPNRLNQGVRPWLLGALALLGIILFYLALGAMQGETRDALVYFRNTVTPVACLYIGIVVASLFRVDITRGITWLAVIAIAFGYCELFFTFEFLSLFNGDRYTELTMARQIDSGYWEQVLRETGFVVRDLNDVMMTSFFNTPLLADIFPDVFRIGGPNFHPISFAYALAIFSCWLMFQNRVTLPLFALPLLIVVGSKGAMFLFLMSLSVWIGLRVLTPRATLILFGIAIGIWIASTVAIGITTADYHALGLVAGIRDFLGYPLGQGLGIGGILSGAVADRLDWGLAQQSGATEVPVESAIGVMLYQMGFGGLVFVGFILALARQCLSIFFRTGSGGLLFGAVGITTLTANALLQEEAFYSPLALGLCLLLTGMALADHAHSEAVQRLAESKVKAPASSRISPAT